MSPESFTVLKAIFGAGAALATLLAAWFEFKDRGQTDEQRRATRQKYGKWWRVIRKTGILELPERVITKTHKQKSRFPNAAQRAAGFVTVPTAVTALLIALLTGLVITWAQYGMLIALLWLVPLASYGSARALHKTTLGHRLADVTIVLGCVGWAISGLLLVRLALTLPTMYATMTFVVSAPLFALFMGVPLAFIVTGGNELLGRTAEGTSETALLLGVGMVISFSSTMIALLVGHFASPNAYVPQTFQMMLANVVCDGITLVTTFAILGLAVRERRRWPIPAVILFDIVVAALLAGASLYVGLIGTDQALSLQQVGYVLIGMSHETQQWEIGPYFWAMHTTFLPSLLYLSLILFTWVGKLIVLPIAGIFRKGGEIEKPHHYTAGALFLVAAALFALSWFVGFMEPKPEPRSHFPGKPTPVVCHVQDDFPAAHLE